MLTVEQWEEWVEFYKLEPFGPHADDTRHAMLCMLIARANGAEEAKLSDFMLAEAPEPEEEDPVDTIASLFGGKPPPAGPSTP